MHALILSSRCTEEQRNALTVLRGCLEAHGDVCEALDWFSFLADSVSQINAHSRKLVRRHVQELLTEGLSALSKSEAEAPEKGGFHKLVNICAKELARFIREGEYELVLCAEPVASMLLSRASREVPFPAVTVLVGTDDNLRRQSALNHVLSPESLSSEPALEKTRTVLEKLVEGKRSPAVKNSAPTVQSSLRHQILKMPSAVYEASGIVVNGRRIKSLLFTTDLAIIRNCDADAIFAVYPFTPQQAISEAIIKAAYVPVFCGVGGGTTKGVRTVGLAKDAEGQGAMGIVLNAPISNPNLRAVSAAVDIPVVITVVNEDTNIARRLESGAAIINVAGGIETPDIVRKIRSQYPDVPIIATGGGGDESIRETIMAGANAITITPPSTKDLFRVTMSKYREM